MIYLDNQATTPCDRRVLDAMLPWFTEAFGNPHSAEHALGRQAADAVERARAQIAALIGADEREIILLSGATEANNLAIKGAARFAGPGERRRIITVATEHKCVLETVGDLAAEGFESLILPVAPDGALDLDALQAALRTPTRLVSVMAVNNETGFRQDLPAISRLVHDAGALLHSDIAQAAGKIALDVEDLHLDLASISGHKIYGPKGIGALYVRRRPRVRLTPLFSGGGQERGFRSGTIPAPLAVGLGEACAIAAAEWRSDAARIAALRDRLLAALSRRIPGLVVHGPAAPERYLAGCLSLRFPAVRALDLIAACPALCVSTGSACTSADVAPSHVLTALGLTRAQAAATLRLGLGRFTSAADIDAAASLLAGAHARLAHTATPSPAEA
jgi:cysteine desulfurase